MCCEGFGRASSVQACGKGFRETSFKKGLGIRMMKAMRMGFRLGASSFRSRTWLEGEESCNTTEGWMYAGRTYLEGMRIRMYPKPYTLNHTPDTLHPTPDTLHPKAEAPISQMHANSSYHPRKRHTKRHKTPKIPYKRLLKPYTLNPKALSDE